MRFVATLVIAVLVIVGSVLLPTPLFAQALPWKVTFTASPDHAAVVNQVTLVDHYELRVFAPGASTALPAIQLGKPTPDASNLITVNVDAQLNALPASPTCNLQTPTAAQCYTAKVAAVGPGGESVSALSDPFGLIVPAPRATGKPGISR